MKSSRLLALALLPFVAPALAAVIPRDGPNRSVESAAQYYKRVAQQQAAQNPVDSTVGVDTTTKGGTTRRDEKVVIPTGPQSHERDADFRPASRGSKKRRDGSNQWNQAYKSAYNYAAAAGQEAQAEYNQWANSWKGRSKKRQNNWGQATANAVNNAWNWASSQNNEPTVAQTEQEADNVATQFVHDAGVNGTKIPWKAGYRPK